MLSAARIWLPMALLAMAVRDSYGGAADNHYGNEPDYSTTTTTCTTLVPVVIHSTSTAVVHEVIVTSTTTTTTVPTTTTGHATETVPSTVTVSTTTTTTTPTTTTVPTTKTVPTTITVSVTTTVVMTVFTTTTIPTTTTITSTFTTFPIRTSYTTSTVYDPCPSSCSITAGTVRLVYWPTNGVYSYPATYFDPSLDYTFTSPSVYFLINTMYGTNSQGRVGPSASSTIWPFNLDQVSTLVLPAETATQQLYLNDLATDCPQSLPASVLATKKPNPSCDPILLAPTPIRRWAWPCNACRAFGLFDPPYAIPTITGGLVVTTTVVPAPTTPTPTPAATITPAPESTITTTITDGNSRIVMLEYYSGTNLLSSSPIATEVLPASTTAAPSTTSQPPTTSSSPAVVASSSTAAVTAAAARITGGKLCLMLNLIVSVSLLW